MDNINKDFKVLCSLYLEDLDKSPSSYLYKTLVPHYKPVYAPDERFIFYNFDTVSAEALEHFVQTVDYIDISRFFCLIITDQHSTVEYFKQLDPPFSIEVVESALPRSEPELSTITQPIFYKQNFCAHAWSGIHLSPNGNARICCDYTGDILKPSGDPYNIKDFSINEIVNSDYMKQIRAQFRQGKTPEGCQRCTERESLGADSKRSLSRFKLENIHGHIDWESDNCTDHPKFLGGHIGNLCNLRCRICSPEYSSQIAAEDIKTSTAVNDVQKIKTVLIDNNWNKAQKSFWQEIRENNKLINFEFLGGEPLLLQENLKFMQYLIDTKKSHNCIFEFTTNGTQFNEIFNQSDKFKRLTVTISIDNVGSRFEYERKNAVWDQVEQNIEKFITSANSSNSLNVGICITVSVLNVLYLPEVIDWLDKKKITHYYYNILNYPSELSIDMLTENAKQVVLDKLKNYNIGTEHKNKLHPIIQAVKQSRCSDGTEFCNYIRKKDLVRNESLHNSHKEIAQAMGYVL